MMAVSKNTFFIILLAGWMSVHPVAQAQPGPENLPPPQDMNIDPVQEAAEVHAQPPGQPADAVKHATDAAAPMNPVVNSQDVQNGVKQINNLNNSGLGSRDPFQRPKYIDDLESQADRDARIDIDEDERVEAIRRWPLRDYKATAIMWDIQNPKVMITDRKGTLHLLKKNYRIGNRNGIITAINEGEIVITESGLPVVMKIEAQQK